ncbi:MAG: hypothetical protein WA624_23550 [Methylocella sp.]
MMPPCEGVSPQLPPGILSEAHHGHRQMDNAKPFPDDVLQIDAPPATERCFGTPRTSAAIPCSCFAVSCFAVDAGFACPFERSRQPTIFSAS